MPTGIPFFCIHCHLFSYCSYYRNPHITLIIDVFVKHSLQKALMPDNRAMH